VAVATYWRRVRRRFSISAPRMAVRTHLGWPGRIVVGAAFAAVVAGMWWWGFDFGQIFSGVNRQEIEARLATLEADASTAMREARALRERNTQLESEGAMMQGAQAALQKQARELSQENAQLKEEVAFLQQLFADANRVPGLGIQRLVVERDGEDVLRYSLLVVRGGNPKDDFDGYLTLQAVLVPAPGAPPDVHSQTLSLPEDAPESKAPLRLRFKYYQRVEGVIRIPPGLALRTLTARAYENGTGSPRATRSLTNS
jgi:hypothetical protein